MATSAYYPPSALPWQVFETNIGGGTIWSLDLVDYPTDEEPLATLLVAYVPSRGWQWDILPGPLTRAMGAGSIVKFSTYELCELDLLHGLAWWLHGPPSRRLPPQEGATSRGKEADCA